MATSKMHLDELDTDISLVVRLLITQFPQWANLPIKQVRSAGTGNALYRLGDDMVARLPRIPSAVGQVDKEQKWLPRLAPRLPLKIPIPLAKGKPSDGYPWHWSVYQWLEGEDATIAPISNLRQAATDLAQFIIALQQIEATEGPPPGQHNFYRGVPLAMRDQQTRDAIAALQHLIDVDEATAAWDAAIETPTWHRAPVWSHGDLHAGNLLVRQGRLSAVIDFGGLGVGDPACDVMAAWTLLSAENRLVFRELLQVDDATWARGRGWALSFGLIALPYYQISNPILAGIARRAIDEVLADHRDVAFCDVQ